MHKLVLLMSTLALLLAGVSPASEQQGATNHPRISLRDHVAETRPDPDQGVIGGEVAVVGWPLREANSDSYLDPAGYEMHLTPADDLGHELVYPAGRWFQPPTGRYRAWIEGRGSISATVTLLSYAGGPFRGKGVVFADTVSSGATVALGTRADDPAVELRLLHLDSHAAGWFPRMEMARCLRGGAAHQGALMPSGRLLASLFDLDANEYLALGQPIEVQPGEHVTVDPAPPARGTSDLLVVLERPKPIARHDEADLTLTLRAGDERLAPHEIVRAATRVTALWYGLSTRRAKLEVTSSRVFLEPVDVPLRPGRVEYVTGSLRQRPSLAVDVELPERLDAPSATLNVRTLGQEDLLSEARLAGARRGHLFESLPPEELLVSLLVPPWRFTQAVSLVDGEDRTLRFAPDAIELHGTVFLGDEEVAAEIAFEIDGTQDTLTVPTDEHGDYEVVLYQRVSALSITLRDRQAPAFLDYLMPPLSSSGRHDFVLPDNRFEVEVVDADSHEPVADALVHVQNTASSGFGYNVSAPTSEEGIATLPPLRAGLLSFSASATGFAPMPDPVVEEIDPDDSGRRLRLTLSPEGERRPLLLRLPSGLPAAGASACIKRSLSDEHARWCGTSDPDGRFDVPRSALPGILLARHDAAGFLVEDLADLPQELALPKAARTSLSVVTTDGFGSPVAWADVALFLGEIKLAGSTLGWLTDSPPGRIATGSGGRDTFQLGPSPFSPRGSTPESAPAPAPSTTSDETWPFPGATRWSFSPSGRGRCGLGGLAAY